MLLRWLLLGILAGQATAHINLLFPLPINSKNDPQTPEASKDYSMTAPLNQDGSNWPAKGYATSETVSALNPVATLVAGEEFTWTTEGTATHNGGSCQVGISYDLLATTAIMASWIGECPMSGSYTFTVPDIPGSEKALFLWVWFNKTGNREMYSNAAVVAVSGTATSFKGPSPFRANTFADGSCINTEGVDQGFPNPGDQTGQELSNCSWDNNSDVTVTSDGTSAEAPASSSGGAATSGGGGTAATGSSTTTAAAPSGSGGAGEAVTATTAGGVAAGTTSKAATSAAGAGTAATTAAAPTSTSTSTSDTIGGFTYKEVSIALGFAVLAALLAVLIVCVSKRKGGSDSDPEAGGGGGRRRRIRRRKHRYAPAHKSDTETESSGTGTGSEATETDESTDDEKGSRRRR
ncbi:hypothetical protein BCR35DRAFT_328665 [Leucosporidium creatinivorum]|uniref:Uncharacterized protein n=1 Tax=Leucosporidium creatinivorum TaxID=106004 RepID=A0A1Y2G5X9_9BASI|nr:hypothetical protein BCR35DRAFT_328665 [Leucosporidium creatinivorum]